MSNRLLVSVAAAALIAGTGLAYGQGGGTNHEQGGAGIQSSSPSTSRSGAEQGGAMHHRLSPQHSAQSQQKNSTVGKASPGEGQASDQKKGVNSENEAAGQNEMKSQGRQGRTAQGNESPKQAEQRKSQTTGQHQGQAASTSGRSEMQKSPAATQSGSQERSQTTGQAGAGAKLSTQQRSQITSAIKDEHVTTTKNVNFSVAVGTRVPREHVSLHPLPSRVVKIYPEWRGYKFILVRDEIVVVNPRTYEIVAVLPG